MTNTTRINGKKVYGEWLGSAVGRYLELMSMTWSGASYVGQGGRADGFDGLELSGRLVAPLLSSLDFLLSLLSPALSFSLTRSHPMSHPRTHTDTGTDTHDVQSY